jgi:hypothetical protein
MDKKQGLVGSSRVTNVDAGFGSHQELHSGSIKPPSNTRTVCDGFVMLHPRNCMLIRRVGSSLGAV